MKSIFTRHGIPKVVMSDNRPQYSSHQLISDFAKDYEFSHHTSSPRFPKVMERRKRGVKTVKDLLKKSALLTYRSTPLQNGYTTSKLLMNCTTVLMLRKQLKPSIPDRNQLSKRERSKRLSETEF